MSLRLNERYPGRFNNPSADYPGGSFKNRTTPDAKDGSYLEKDWANDKEGFFQSLLEAAGVVANGNVDKVGSSQFFDALTAIIEEHSPNPPDASTTVKGLVELATSAETKDGVDAVRAVTPAGANQVYAKKFIMVVVDEKAPNTAGGNNAAGDNTRTLNTVRNNTIVGASLSSNQITLPAGTYRVAASAPFYGGDRHRCYLYNVTSSAVAILGTNENAGAAFTTRSFARGVFTIAAPAVFELRQYCDVVATNGFGDAVIDGRPAVFAEIEFKQEG